MMNGCATILGRGRFLHPDVLSRQAHRMPRFAAIVGAIAVFAGRPAIDTRSPNRQGRLPVLYVGIADYSMYSTVEERTAYCLFFPDGRVYAALPESGHVSDFDFARAVAEDPQNCGRYQIMGNRIRFQWYGGREGSVVSFRRVRDGIEIDGTA